MIDNAQLTRTMIEVVTPGDIIIYPGIGNEVHSWKMSFVVANLSYVFKDADEMSGKSYRKLYIINEIGLYRTIIHHVGTYMTTLKG